MYLEPMTQHLMTRRPGIYNTKLGMVAERNGKTPQQLWGAARPFLTTGTLDIHLKVDPYLPPARMSSASAFSWTSSASVALMASCFAAETLRPCTIW